MKRILNTLLFLALLNLAAAPAVRAAEGEGTPPGMSGAEMQKMQELMSPGPVHQQLARNQGHWKTTTKMYMGPGEPQISTGTAHGEMILGGRYSVLTHSGEFMGMPFEGKSIDGYDNNKQQLFSIWIDNFGTGFLELWGSPTADGRGADYTGSMFDPMLGKDCKIRETIRWDGDDKYRFEMFQEIPGPDGKVAENKVMEMTVERVK